jgi:hypothetical protein
MHLSNAQIGRCGELLVQLKLLMHGIESSPLTTDAGIDLVAFSPRRQQAITIQVKTNLVAKPGGGKGKPALDWWADDQPKAEIFAFVDLQSLRVWLVESSALATVAQQHPPGRFHFFMAVDPTTTARRDGKRVYDYEFGEYLFENRVVKIFGEPTVRPNHAMQRTTPRSGA